MPPKLRACEGPVSFGDAEATGSRTMSTRHGPRGAAAEIRLRIAILLIRSDQKTGGQQAEVPVGAQQAEEPVVRIQTYKLESTVPEARSTRWSPIQQGTKCRQQQRTNTRT